MWFLYSDGVFRMLTDRGSRKHRNCLHSSRAAVCVEDGKFGYVAAECLVSVQDAVSYEERLALHTHYRGPEAARRVVSDGRHEHMVMLVLRPERWLYRRPS